jgi:hypothetical protein
MAPGAFLLNPRRDLQREIETTPPLSESFFRRLMAGVGRAVREKRNLHRASKWMTVRIPTTQVKTHSGLPHSIMPISSRYYIFDEGGSLKRISQLQTRYAISTQPSVRSRPSFRQA